MQQVPNQTEKKEDKRKINLQVKKVETVLRSNPRKEIIERVETDQQFAEDVVAIAEFTRISRKEGQLHELSEEEYEFVESVGDVHYEAQLFNETAIKNENADPQKKCKCGCNKCGGQSLSLCTAIEEQPYFGSAIILFFFYNRHLFLLILLVIFIYGIYALTTNLVIADYTMDCSKPGALPFMCEVKIVTSLEGKKTRDDLLLVELILGLVLCIFWAIGIRIIRDRGRVKNQELDDSLDSAADEWIMMDGFPAGKYNQKNVLDFLNKLWNQIYQQNKGKLKIKGVQICYRMDQVRKKIEQIQNLAKNIDQMIEKQEKQNVITYQLKNGVQKKQYEEEKAKILKLHKQLVEFRQNFIKNEQFRVNRSSACIFVNFQSTTQRQLMVEKKGNYRMTMPKQKIQIIKQSCCSSKFTFPKYDDQYIKLIKAPEPSDIIWAHCQYNTQKKYIFLVWLINFLLVCCSFGAFLLVRHIKQQNPDRNGLSSLGIITLNLFNRLIWNVLGKVVIIEKNHTKTDNLVSIMNKNYVASSINIIVVPLIITGGLDNNFISPSGLTGTIHDYQITAFGFMILFNLINLPYRWSQLVRCIKCLRRSAIKKYCKIIGKLDSYTEMKEALVEVYEPPVMPLVGIYVFVTSTLMQAAFFCQGSPIVFFYMGVSMILFRIVNRWLLLKVCKAPDMIDFIIFQVCIGFAMNVPLLYGTGSLFLLGLSQYPPNAAYYIPSIFCIIIWFISILNPCGIISKITSCCVSDKKAKVTDTEEGRQIGANLTFDLLQNPQIKNEKVQRKENYYGNSSISVMFNFESQLQKVQGRYHGYTKQYCEQHKL